MCLVKAPQERSGLCGNVVWVDKEVDLNCGGLVFDSGERIRLVQSVAENG